MNILFVHPNFPAQYVYLSQYFAQNPKNKVFFLTKQTNDNRIAGVNLAVYKEPNPATKNIHPYVVSMEEAVLEGQAVYHAAAALKQQTGFTPDVIIGHTGWGSTLYLKDLFPDVPLIGYFEWFYRAYGSDVGYWADEIVHPNAQMRIRSKNAHHLLNLSLCDARYCPTEWQRQQFPDEYKNLLHVLHEGTDTDFCQPNEDQKLILPEQKIDLTDAEEIITYVSRGFESYRGFPQFMDAIRIVLRNRPKCHVVLVGADRTCYGPLPAPDKTYKQCELEKGGLDLNRVHFAGLLKRTDYLHVLQASTVHVYLTRPFVLSWSMLEAMSAGVCLVASATPPVQEVVEDGVNGLLANFRSPEHIASRIEEALENKTLRDRLGKAARETVLARYSLKDCLRKQVNFIYSMLK